MTPVRPAGLPAGTRDPRLDFFRGLSMVMIYINHVPGTIYETVTSRNFGLSDAAEGFFFMSGCAVALAYGTRLSQEGMNWFSIRKGWHRAWQLYAVHILTTIWTLGIASAVFLYFKASPEFVNNSFGLLREMPYQVMLGVALLTHQFGYVNILPTYAVLMLAAPFMVRLGQKAPLGLALGSLALWAAAGHWQINMPSYPEHWGWFLNPFSWQLIFSLGILTGLGLRKGRRFVPLKGWLIALATAWVFYCLLWVKIPALKETMETLLASLRAEGWPYLLTAYDKTYVALPRLAHFLALAYLLSLPGLIHRFAGSWPVLPFRVIGRHGLPVFALLTVLAIFSQAVKSVNPAGGILQDTVLIIGGIGLLWGFATVLDRVRIANQREKEQLQKTRA